MVKVNTDLGVIEASNDRQLRGRYLCRYFEKECNEGRCENNKTYNYSNVVKKHRPMVKTKSSGLIKSNLSFKKCPFVVVTYLWNLNKPENNSQKPCKFLKIDKVTKKPHTYGEVSERLIESCEKHNINYYVQEVPYFGVSKKYQIGINYKPGFIKHCLDKFKRPVVYVDSDLVFKQYPYLFNDTSYDVMNRHWNVNPEQSFYSKYNKGLTYDPFLYHTSGGVQYFNYTYWGRKMVNYWIQGIKDYPLKADDVIFSWVVAKMGLLAEMRILFLPSNYLWLTDEFEDFKNLRRNKSLMNHPSVKRALKNNKYKQIPRKSIVLEHPDCLTTEESASNQMGKQGEGKLAYPRISGKPRVVNLIRNIMAWENIQCENWDDFTGQYYFTYLLVQNQKQADQLEPYMKYFKRYDDINFVSFKGKYGPFNKLVNKNNEKIKKMKPKMKYINRKESKKPILILFNNEVYRKMDTIIFEDEKNMSLKVLWAIKTYKRPVIVSNEVCPPLHKLKHYHHADIMMHNKKTDEMWPKYRVNVPEKSTVFIRPGKVTNFLLHLWHEDNMNNLGSRFDISANFLTCLNCIWY